MNWNGFCLLSPSQRREDMGGQQLLTSLFLPTPHPTALVVGY